MNSGEKSCDQCGTKHTQQNRVITDSCGHQKCRHCFIKEENHCQQCADKPLTSVPESFKKDVQNSVKKSKNTELFTHIEEVYAESGAMRYHCTECNKVFSSRSQKYYHLSCNTKQQQQLHKCDKCQKVFGKISHLKYHLESHTSIEWRCSQCSKVFGNRLILRKHEKIHDEKMQSKTCSHCKKTYRSKDSLATHIAAKHNKILAYGCSQCDKCYASKSMLQQHLLGHQNSLKYRCIHCDTTILRKDNMLRHIRIFHSNSTFDQSIETIQLQAVISTHENYETNGTSNEEFHKMDKTQSPKTVENSSVIKCIGNVEPVRVPNTVELGKSDTTKLINETHNESHLENIAEQYEYRHKMPKKMFNIELYRRILEDDDESNNDNEQSRVSPESPSSLPTNSDGVISHQPTEEKRTPLHWRKNFKYNYELTEF
uniref:C2H2-type domain-containing protein n=1 Tax=Glossina brevipalpis TaxID=37001 RepID=A0A1A9W7D4_9MUSC